MLVGYARASTLDPTLGLRQGAKTGCASLITDVASGT
jgi:hypothetical protein